MSRAVKPPLIRATRPRSTGSSLIEVLVAVLVMSAGLLGLIALQSRVLRASVDNIQRTQAIMLGQYLIEMMRADRTEAMLGRYDGASGTWRCDAALITGTTLAANNLRDALSAAQSALGRPGDTSTCIRVDCRANGVCEVALQWTGRSSTGAVQNQVISTRL